MRTVFILLVICFLPLTVAYAAGGGQVPIDVGATFVPIVPIPDTTGQGLATSHDASGYVNIIFEYAIIAGAGLAAIYIGIGGFEYILSEATETKRNGRLRITHALLGLMILLLVTIVLYIINPDIVSLKFLQ